MAKPKALFSNPTLWENIHTLLGQTPQPWTGLAKCWTLGNMDSWTPQEEPRTGRVVCGDVQNWVRIELTQSYCRPISFFGFFDTANKTPRALHWPDTLSQVVVATPVWQPHISTGDHWCLHWRDAGRVSTAPEKRNMVGWFSSCNKKYCSWAFSVLIK